MEYSVAGGCHCGTIRFHFTLPSQDLELLVCNCSMCSRNGFLHLIVPHADFELQATPDGLASYRFGTGIAEHLFCKNCGVKAYYQPRSHPSAWRVNYRCLDHGHGLTPTIVPFDGQDWENARAALSG